MPENILLDDIKAKYGNTIIPKDTILTETHIKVIHSFLIEEVNVSSELANGKTFIPQEVTQISKKPTTSSPSKRTKDLSFEKQYEQSVQAYKEMFHKWQSGLAGNTTGSFCVSSKFGTKSTVSLSISRNNCDAILESRVSVYRIAAAGSPSILPLFPCISISSFLIFQSCLNRTIAS